ncbi:bacterial regulatory, arsR family protein [Heyndrickxia coagulans DSM 1 = ATCC 7050]|uniref:Regulatory protein, arsR family n=1 Tax=Heyndrickxia coagulans DSM 1 = ATCC 7050 TaxID=1121088 RepID=A0A8B4BYH1_HEYCO|nr:bacterial regulatory, arsR family protein [Heyndrickxia coagulans DSM 1 = ATCC 7050]SHG05274.1 regulatory protein, arsR family [Heyndrickxia coagulans DSM 1 = ATCC 7050]
MSTKDTCEIYCYDEEKVNRIQGELAKHDISSVALLFKAIADENRTKIVFSLCQDDELCVCDVANIIGSSVATASHHLRTLDLSQYFGHQ